MVAARGLKLALAGAAALPLAGCLASSAAHMWERYGTTPGIAVRLGCADTYEVFDRPNAGAMLVATNGISEAQAAACSSGLTGLPQEERLRRVARIFLEEKTSRPRCEVSRATRLSELHIEFNYRCPDPDAPRASRARGVLGRS